MDRHAPLKPAQEDGRDHLSPGVPCTADFRSQPRLQACIQPTMDTTWLSPSTDLAITADEVHIWRAPLDVPDVLLERLWPTLSEEEQQRAQRFHFDHDRIHFVAAHGVLRAILGAYLKRPPSQLRFATTPYGKPFLTDTAGAASDLTFNLTHSHNLALIAVTVKRHVGIDVEFMRSEFVGEPIAERFFSRLEVAALRSLPPDSRIEGFFNCWTRKEAYIKARGEGLSMPLDQFAVSLAPGSPAALLQTATDPHELTRWRLETLAPAPGFAAAVAVEGSAWRLRCWDANNKFIAQAANPL